MGAGAAICAGSLVGVEVRSPAGYVAYPPAVLDYSEGSTEVGSATEISDLSSGGSAP